MSRNRKLQSAAVRLGPAFRAMFVCTLLVVSGVGYVWQKDQLNDLGRRKVDLEKRLWRLRVRNAQVHGQLVQLQSPPALEARVKELGLGLGEPAPTQIVRLVDPPAGATPWPPVGGRQDLARAEKPAR